MSARLLFVRHAQTLWNQQGRIQGHTDVDLCAQGRRDLSRMTVPAPWSEGRCFSSPLTRAVHTARLLGLEHCAPVPALSEMSWGDWEGSTLAELRSRHGQEMTRNEARGLDFRPTGGESPREVMARLGGWLAQLPPRETACVVTHKGVIRAMLALATGWDMKHDFPATVRWDAGHAFRIEGTRARVERLNVPLVPHAGGGGGR